MLGGTSRSTRRQKRRQYYVVQSPKKRITVHFERIRPFIAKFCDYKLDDNGELEYLLDSASERLTVIWPHMTDPVPEDKCSNAADDEKLVEPSVRRKYILRKRQEKREDINENYIGSDKTTITTEDGNTSPVESNGMFNFINIPKKTLPKKQKPGTTTVPVTIQEPPVRATVTFDLENITIVPSEDTETAENVSPPHESDDEDERSQAGRTNDTVIWPSKQENGSASILSTRGMTNNSSKTT
jgi:hypothetical protein